MSEETRKVLEMLSSGKISVQEAEQLLQAVTVSASENGEKKAQPKYFRILVNKPASDSEIVRAVSAALQRSRKSAGDTERSHVELDFGIDPQPA